MTDVSAQLATHNLSWVSVVQGLRNNIGQERTVMRSRRQKATWFAGIAALGLAFSSGTAHANDVLTITNPASNTTKVTLTAPAIPLVPGASVGYIGPISVLGREVVPRQRVFVPAQPGTETLQVVFTVEMVDTELQHTRTLSGSSSECSGEINEVFLVDLTFGATGRLVLTGTAAVKGGTPLTLFDQVIVDLDPEPGEDPHVLNPTVTTVGFELCPEQITETETE